jgi:hypothetical protein
VWQIARGNDSGRANTYNDNEIITVAVCLLACWLVLREAGGSTDYSTIMQLFLARAGGDNGTLATDEDALVPLVRPCIEQAAAAFGFDVTWETDRVPVEGRDAVIFSHVTVVEQSEFGEVWVPVLVRENKLLSTLWVKPSGLGPEDVFRRLCGVVSEAYGTSLFDRLHQAATRLAARWDDRLTSSALAMLLPRHHYASRYTLEEVPEGFLFSPTRGGRVPAVDWSAFERFGDSLSTLHC